MGYRWWWTFRRGDEIGLRAWVWDLHWRIPDYTEAIHWDEKKSQVLGGMAHMPGIPSEDCTCGIYAWFQLPKALTDIARYKHFVGDKEGLVPVAGAVITGGLTVQHGTEGMRVQYARPVAFAEPHATAEEANDLSAWRATRVRYDLAAAFGVPLMPIDKLEVYAREFGLAIDEVKTEEESQPDDA